MDVEKFRDYCLSFEGVTEKMPFGKFAARYSSILAFYVLDHMFCFIDVDGFTYVNVKSVPEEIDILKAGYTSWGNPINRSLRHWIQLDFGGDIPQGEILRLVARAYELVKLQYTPKRKGKKSF